MSKLTDIKNRIDQMDGGSFQNICDAYLSYKGYKNVYSLGRRTVTDKIALGNPDTYFVSAEKKRSLERLRHVCRFAIFLPRQCRKQEAWPPYCPAVSG